MKKLITLFLLMAMPLMAANEIWFVSTAGQTNLKATVTELSTTKIWDTGETPDAFIATADSAWADRAIDVSEDTDNDGVYYGDFPALITDAGTYLIRIYATDGTLADGDLVVQNFTIDWAGTVEVWLHTLIENWLDAILLDTGTTLPATLNAKPSDSAFGL